MKISDPKKLPSGSWNVRVMVDGRRISITKPTRKACLEEAAAIKLGSKSASAASRGTLTAAIDRYIGARQNILSPSTIRGYRMIQKHRFQAMMPRILSDLRPDQWQRAVNAEAKLCSAKTLTNAWRFISSVIAEETGQKFVIRLPQVVAAERPWLTPDQIPVFINEIHGRSVEIPALLALSSLRRSELLELRWDNVDLKKGIIRVAGAAVYDEDSQLVRKKENKNKASARIVPIIPPLRAALEAVEDRTGYVCKLAPSTIYSDINRACGFAGLPPVGIHGLRHSFASLAYHLQIPERITMQIGGWSNERTIHEIYTHIAAEDVGKSADKLAAFYDFGNGNWQQK